MAISINPNQSGTGIIGGISSEPFDVPPSAVEITEGAQINNITEFSSQNGGGEVPVYTYVVEGIPRVSISLDQGVVDDPANLAGSAPDTVTARFLTIGGGETTVEVSGLQPDPAGSASVGTNGSNVSFIKENKSN